MDAAIEQAEKGWSEGGIPIGSVLARADGTIVARGHNQRVQSGDPLWSQAKHSPVITCDRTPSGALKLHSEHHDCIRSFECLVKICHDADDARTLRDALKRL